MLFFALNLHFGSCGGEIWLGLGMVIYFHSKNPSTAWLSNLAAYGFVLAGIKWRSVEHYYQAAKYEDAALIRRVRDATTGEAARKVGQDRSLVPRENWQEIKMEVMKQALEAKFSQNRKLRDLLLATSNEELVHESKTDRFWGRDRVGVGENRLGEMLMMIRAQMI